MKGLWISILLLALGGTTAAQAATGTCSAVRPAVQHLYCTHPALRAMSRSVEALGAPAPGAPARQRQDDGRDQQLWQAERDEALWTLMSNASYTEDAVLRHAWAMERDRQAFLLGQAGHGAMLSPALARMAGTLRDHQPGTRDPLAVWARHDKDVTTARTLHNLPGTLSQVFARIGLHPDLSLRMKVSGIADGQPTLDLVWLPEARLGAVVAIQGTADCQYMTWFRASRDGMAHAIAAPMLDQSPCGRTRLTLLRVGYDTYVALERMHGPYAVDVSMQAWLDGRWASPGRMRMRFDHSLRVSQLRCADGACARYLKSVSTLAQRYDAMPQGRHMGDVRLKPGERARARQLLQLAHRDRNQALGSMPMAGHEPMATFCGESSFFLLRVDGRLLVGRIGHGYLGWRRADGWRIGLWDIEGGTLVPVAGAVVQRPRGRLLAMAAMPPAVIPTR